MSEAVTYDPITPEEISDDIADIGQNAYLITSLDGDLQRYERVYGLSDGRVLIEVEDAKGDVIQSFMLTIKEVNNSTTRQNQ